jgi:hypothetical protein
MSVPQFAVDRENRAALVVGRAAEVGPLSAEQLRRCLEIAAEHSKATQLPLAFVCAMNVSGDEDDDDGGSAGAAAGLLLAHAASDQPTEVAKDLLGRHRPDEIPQGFWDALAEAGATFRPADEDDEFPREGLFLVPGGWSIATLRLGRAPTIDEIEAAEDKGEEPPTDQSVRVLSTAAENDMAAALVRPKALERIAASDAPLFLEAGYC